LLDLILKKKQGKVDISIRSEGTDCRSRAVGPTELASIAPTGANVAYVMAGRVALDAVAVI